MSQQQKSNTYWIKKGKLYILAEPNRRVRYIPFKDHNDLNKIANALNKKDYEYDYKYEINCVKIWSNSVQYKGTISSLPPGQSYFYKDSGYPLGEYMKPMKLRTDEETFFIEKQYEDIKSTINNFISNEQKYIDAKYLYKMGIMLYGPPGNGKTAFIRYLTQNLLPEGSTVIWCKTVPSIEASNAFSKIPGLKVLIFEELTNSISTVGS